jgi:hypothetical protein
MRITLLSLIIFVSLPTLAQVGFYRLTEAPGAARKFGEMCIEKGDKDSLHVPLFGSYCPTVGNDCANVRFDDLIFDAKLERGVLRYMNENCSVRVVLSKSGATITQQGHCSDYDLLAGQYAKRAAEVWEADCTPTGADDMHHK